MHSKFNTVSIDNIDTIKALNARPLVKVPEPPKNFLTTAIFLEADKVVCGDLEAELNQRDMQPVFDFFSQTHDNVSILHRAIANPDINVFKAVLKFFRDNNLSYEHLIYTPLKPTEAHFSQFISTGDTPLNVALKLGDREKINYLLDNGFTDFSCLSVTTIYKDRFHGQGEKGLPVERVQGISIFEYFCRLIANDRNFLMSGEESINYYIDFALQFGDFNTIANLKPYSEHNRAENEAIINSMMPVKNSDNSDNKKNVSLKNEMEDREILVSTNYRNLVYVEQLFLEENFVRLMLPKILSTVELYTLYADYLGKPDKKLHNLRVNLELIMNNLLSCDKVSVTDIQEIWNTFISQLTQSAQGLPGHTEVLVQVQEIFVATTEKKMLSGQVRSIAASASPIGVGGLFKKI